MAAAKTEGRASKGWRVGSVGERSCIRYVGYGFFLGDLVTQMLAGILATLHWEPAGKCLKQKRNAQLSSECKKTERETGGERISGKWL
jgi:hypothetical protein